MNEQEYRMGGDEIANAWFAYKMVAAKSTRPAKCVVDFCAGYNAALMDDEPTFEDILKDISKDATVEIKFDDADGCAYPWMVRIHAHTDRIAGIVSYAQNLEELRQNIITEVYF